MKYSKTRLLACILGLVALQAPAIADDWYIVPAAVYTDDAPKRMVDDMVGGGQVSIGKYLNDNFALEGVLGYSTLEGTLDVDIFEASLDGLVMFRRDAWLSPYFLVGLGAVNTESEYVGNDTALLLNAGVGLDVSFGDSPVGVRLEYRERMSDGPRGSLNDGIASLGVRYNFGSKPMPTPVAVAPPDPDSDGDGVNDSRDACPETPAGHRVDARGCSLDGDRDGVADANDACPNTVSGATVDARGCEMDDDKDGVVNRLDRCPGTTAGVRVDVNGCEIREVIELPGVNFQSNSDRLLPGADNVLRDAAATLRRYPDLVVEVAGHTDSAGAAEYNQGLSERRANTVRDYLINAGANAATLSARGYGEIEPIADNTTNEGRARNRRVELRIIE